MTSRTSRARGGPRGTTASRPTPTTRNRAASKTNRGGRLFVIASALMVVLAALYLLRPSLSDDGVPRELVGHWTTTNNRYADRGFSLSQSTLALFTSASDSTVYRIQSATREERAGDVLYTIRYEDQGGVLPFAVAYGPRAQDGSPEWIHFPHQPEIEWRREQGP